MTDKFYLALMRNIKRLILQYGGKEKLENQYCLILEFGDEDIILPKLRTGCVEIYFYNTDKEIKDIFRYYGKYKKNAFVLFRKKFLSRLFKEVDEYNKIDY